MKLLKVTNLMCSIAMMILSLLLICSPLSAETGTISIISEAKIALEQGRLYQDRGDYRRAIQEYDKAIHLRPSFSSETYNNRGVTYVKLGNLERGLQDFSAAIALDSNYADAYYSRGTIYFRLGAFSHAKADLSKAIELNQKYADDYYNLTIIYDKLGHSNKETEDFVNALELNPQKNSYTRDLSPQMSQKKQRNWGKSRNA